MTGIDLNAVAQVSASRIFDCLLEGMIIALFAGAVAWLARREESKTRFAIWLVALMAIAGLPLVNWSFGPGHVASSAQAAFTVSSQWAVYMVAVWAAIALLGLVRVSVGLWHIYALRMRCEPVDPATLDEALKHSLVESSVRAAVCVSEEVNVPAAIGLLKPAVVFPRWAWEEMSAEELRQILLHELAHLERRDDWTNLAQKIVKALFFFHPAVWWIERQLSVERELACDDAVLATIESPRAYAECLAHLAERSFVQRSIALAQAALGHIRQTSQRVARILNAGHSGSGRAAWKLAIPAVAVFAVGSGVAISRAPRLVAFTNSVPSVSAPVIASDIDNAMHLPVVNAKLDARSISQPAAASRIVKHATRKAMPSATATSAGMIHLAHMRVAPVAATQTVFVVFEEQQTVQTDQGLYSIQVWRLTVYHPANDQAENKIPRKET